MHLAVRDVLMISGAFMYSTLATLFICSVLIILIVYWVVMYSVLHTFGIVCCHKIDVAIGLANPVKVCCDFAINLCIENLKYSNIH